MEHTLEPHLYVEDPNTLERCVFCGLPLGNKRHNSRPVQKELTRGKYRRRERYAD